VDGKSGFESDSLSLNFERDIAAYACLILRGPGANFCEWESSNAVFDVGTVKKRRRGVSKAEDSKV
jgi:hypothetical protein